MTTTPVSPSQGTAAEDAVADRTERRDLAGRPGGFATLTAPLISRVPGKLVTGALIALPLVVVLLIWQVLTANHVVFWLRFDKLPGPGEVFDALRVQLASGSYYQDLLASLRRILLGFGLAAVSGVAVGIAIGRSRLVRAALRPLIEVSRPIPAIALVPLAILLFPHR
ncbi:MAG: ABC transporter permease [Pseudonocardiaceae bacterium]